MFPEQKSPLLPELFLITVVVLFASALFGVVTYLSMNPQGVKIFQTLPSPKPTVIDDDGTKDLSSKALATDGWQTYRNEKYGFEVKYPINYSESKICRTEIGLCIVSDNISIQFDDMTGYSAVPYKGKELEINGIKLVELPLGGNRDGGLNFELGIELGINDFPVKNKYFRILFNTDKPGLEYKIVEFRQILSTFKFTEN